MLVVRVEGRDRAGQELAKQLDNQQDGQYRNDRGGKGKSGRQDRPGGSLSREDLAGSHVGKIIFDCERRRKTVLWAR